MIFHLALISCPSAFATICDGGRLHLKIDNEECIYEESWTNGRTDFRTCSPSPITARPYNPCGRSRQCTECWELVSWSPSTHFTRLRFVVLRHLVRDTDQSTRSRCVPELSLLFKCAGNAHSLWWTLFTLFDLGSAWKWTYIHWKFWFNEVSYNLDLLVDPVR